MSKPIKRKENPSIKLHPRNKNKTRYDLSAMAKTCPALQDFIQPNKRGEDSINFSDPAAVRMLNKAILQFYYGIEYWDFPKENLCPPIPGRAEYLHHIADLLGEDNEGIPMGKNTICLDVGTGASCIYPIIGVTEYRWHFIASDIDPNSLNAAQKNIDNNPSLKGNIILRKQKNAKHIFKGIIQSKDKIDISICNPPFHSSLEEATKGTRRKVKNLTGKKQKSPKLNFSGNYNELIYEGGEYQFICNMITESKIFAKQVLWFSSLVSKESNLKKIYKFIKNKKPADIQTLPIQTGNKSSRIIAWTYFNVAERKKWFEENHSV